MSGIVCADVYSGPAYNRVYTAFVPHFKFVSYLMMKKMDVHSVYAIVLNWNGGARLQRCVRSLLDVDYPALQIVIVDNGSTDQSLDLIRSECANCIHILENNANLGFGAGNNPAIRYALLNGADYVWLVNFDCTADSDALHFLLTGIQSNSSVGVAGSLIMDMDNRDNILAVGGGWIDTFLGFGGHTVRTDRDGKLTYITGASMLISRECIQAVGVFDEQFLMYWEDADFCERARSQGFEIAVAIDSLLFHEESSSLAGQSIKKEMLMAASSTLFFRKHSPFPLLAVATRALRVILKHGLNGRFSEARAYLKAAMQPESISL